MAKLQLEDFGLAPEQSAEDFHAEQQATKAALTQVGVAYSTARAFANALNALDGEEEQARVLTELVLYSLTPEARLKLAFAALTDGDENEELSRHDKTFALELAMDRGPDWCQWLYKFAVLCTKVA